MNKIASNKSIVSVGLCVVLLGSSVSLGGYWTTNYTHGNAAATENQPESAPPLYYGGASCTGGSGRVWGALIAYPYKCADGADECSASLDNSWQMYTKTWSGCNLTYSTWPFEVEYDASWTVGGNSNNGRFSAATTAGSGELTTTVDAEPDDTDVVPGTRYSRWDGRKKEQCAITGAGISVWGVSLSWNSTGDIWEDTPQGSDPVTTVWEGTLDNQTDGGTLVGVVSLKLNTDLDLSATGDTWAERAGTVEVSGHSTTFSF